MADYQVAWNGTTRVATIQAKNAVVPGGSTKIGEFAHVAAGYENPSLVESYKGGESHVFYHHVRDFLYKQGVQDMQRVRINMP